MMTEEKTNHTTFAPTRTGWYNIATLQKTFKVKFNGCGWYKVERGEYASEFGTVIYAAPCRKNGGYDSKVSEDTCMQVDIYARDPRPRMAYLLNAPERN